ncbi:MAG: hypothetical protein LBH06_09355 [Rikenellaceae bacterium]|jgi:hypothetical protein|nr:hypothetical protein [Rikenellaceae bacterium]
MKFYLDDLQADMLPDESLLKLNFSSERVYNPDVAAVRRVVLRLPLSARNLKLFGDPDLVNSEPGFNAQPHVARVEHKDCLLVEGAVRLVAVERSADGWRRGEEQGRLVVEIVDDGPQWVHAARNRRLVDTGLVDTFTMTEEAVRARWGEQTAIQFYPVQRRDLDFPDGSTSVVFLSTEDFHPFAPHQRQLRFARAVFAFA